MELNLPALRADEIAALRLRALYEANGYRLYRTGSFEEYDLYMQNKSFLMGDDIITFNSADGRVMALKPDVTLSIAKNTPAGEQRRVYYSENVFRRARRSGEYREINQMGLEYIGGEGAESEAEVLRLAAESLAVVGSFALDLSHMEFIEAVVALFGDSDDIARETARDALRDKSPHLMRSAASSADLSEDMTEKLAQLAGLSGSFEETMSKARAIAVDIPGAMPPLDELETLYNALGKSCDMSQIGLDFSILNDVAYYNGFMFQGFIEGVPHSVLSGGRYDNLLRRFDKPQGAVGFAFYLDEIGRAENTRTDTVTAKNDGYLNIALPKGRLGSKVYKLFEKAGLSCPNVLSETRKLVFEDAENKVRYFLVKPGDVDIYVERGAADIGVVGKDVLLESGAAVLELFDLELGKCRFAVAGKADFKEDPAMPLRVATKYPSFARRYYASKSRAVEIIKLHGSIELAPLLGLADVIVDIVETGSTIKENELAVLEEIEYSSARLIANSAAWRFKTDKIRELIERLGEIL